MVTSKDKKVIFELDFIGQKQTDGFEWMFAPVDIVA